MRTYEVKPGDSAWSITYAFTGSGARWGELIAANPQKPTVPDGNFRTLQPGEILNIPDSWAPDSTGRVSKHPSQAGPPDPNAPTALDAVTTFNGKPWLSREFFVELLKLARDIKQNPANLLLLFYSESRLLPWAVGKDAYGNSAAFGLSQITSAISVVSDDTRAKIPSMSAAEQIAGPIRTQYAAYGFARTLTAQVLYAYNAAPARVGDGSDSNVLYSAAPDDYAYVASQLAIKDATQRVWHSSEQGLYASNFGLDVNHDGRITIADLASMLKWLASQKTQQPLYQPALDALNYVAKENNVGPFAPWFGDGGVASGGAIPSGSALASSKSSGGGVLALLALFLVARWLA